MSELAAPIAGRITSRNESLADSPETINRDLYGEGWLLEVSVDSATLDLQLESLLDAAEYRRLLGE